MPSLSSRMEAADANAEDERLKRTAFVRIFVNDFQQLPVELGPPEKAYFGDLSHDGAGDSDGDGASDLMEYRSGTNPLEAASRFRAQASVSATTQRVTLSWEAVPGLSYRVEYKNDLSEAYWNVVRGGVTVNGSQATCGDDMVGESSQRFYRVSLVE